MKFLHVSDTHLGYNQYGLFERGKDFFDVFREAVDIAIDNKVDFVIHTGDFFHSSRPSNKVLVEAINVLSKLKDRNIPVFTISGNHDRGSNVRDISPLNILKSAGLTVIDGGTVEHEGIYISGIKYISKAGIRHLGGLRETLEKLAEQSGKGFRILMLHQEFNPYFPDSSLYLKEEIPEGFNYVGIGHYHIAQDPLTINGAYVVQTGSTEFTAYHEAEDKKKKGVYLIDVEGSSISSTFIPLTKNRPFISLKLDEENIGEIIKDLKIKIEQIKDCSDKTPVVIFKGILRKLSIKDIYKILENEGLKPDRENILHFNFNVSREISHKDEHIFIENDDKFIMEQLKKMINNPELFNSVKEVIDILRSFDNIDDAKKYLKENPDLLEL
ncbi:metallophosphoesterase [Persephonella sp.]